MQQHRGSGTGLQAHVKEVGSTREARQSCKVQVVFLFFFFTFLTLYLFFYPVGAALECQLMGHQALVQRCTAGMAGA
jgi:hypothetical protein